MFSTRFIDIPPLVAAGGTVTLPGSKSISNRVLLLAGFSAGRTEIRGLLESDDTEVMLQALRALGCGIEHVGNNPAAAGPDATDEVLAGGRHGSEHGDGQGVRSRHRQRPVVRIDGLAGQLAVREAELFLGNSGTSMRSLAAALALLASSQGGRYLLSGVVRMHERPIGDLVDALRPIGCAIAYRGADGFPPLHIGDGVVHALDLDAPIRVRGDVSSQFLTGLLQALCLQPLERDAHIEVVGELISQPYVAITLDLLARFGVVVHNHGWRRFTIAAGSQLRSPGEVEVEGDASSASYFIALGAIAATPERPVRIEGIGRTSIQGDLAFVDAVRSMGAQATLGDHSIEVARGAWPLKAITLDCNAMPDAAMTLAAMALYAEGTTRLTRIASWRVKETDRIAAMASGLRRLGAEVETGDDFIAVTTPHRWRAAAIDTRDDHRIAMSLSLAAFNALAPNASTGDDTSGRTVDRRTAPRGLPLRILDPRCVAKTFPDYFETLFGLVSAQSHSVPVITIDGPTASGKGTLASAVARRLGYHFLDSGAVYRATALAAMRAGAGVDDEARLAQIASELDLRFSDGQVRVAGQDVTDTLRLEEVGALASRVSAWPLVRAALRARQLSFQRLPGLVADGRDMGTVIFPRAEFKVFLTASAATRAERRCRQLKDRGVSVNIDGLRTELEARDARDRSRAVAPLIPAEDAMLLDNSALTIDASVGAVLTAWEQRRPF